MNLGKTGMLLKKAVVYVRHFVSTTDRLVSKVTPWASTAGCGVVNKLAISTVFAFAFMTRDFED